MYSTESAALISSVECESDSPTVPAGTRRGPSSDLDRVYGEMRDDLLAGLFAPREPLVESALAERYQASRTPVRAAILRLVNDNLVEARPHAVAIVRDITARDVRQIYEIRQSLEGFAAEQAAQVVDRAELERLIASYDAPPGAGGSSDDAGVIPLHFLIARSLGNGRFIDLLCTQSLPLVRLHALYWRAGRARVDAMADARRQSALDEHRAIAQAILAGAADDARKLLVEHLGKAADHLIHLMTSVDLDHAGSSPASSRPNASVALDHMIPGREPLR